MGKGITTTRKSLVTGRSVKPCIQTNARCAPHYKRTSLHLSACVSVRLCVCSSLMLSYLYRENNYTLRVKSPTLFLSTPVLLRHSPSPAGQLNDILKLLAVSTLFLGWGDGLATLSPQPSAVPFGGYLGGFFVVVCASPTHRTETQMKKHYFTRSFGLCHDTCAILFLCA